MIELDKTLKLVDEARRTAAENGVQMPSAPWLDPLWVAVGLLLLGLVLALWGSRFMRAGLVIAFMIAGAVAGKQLAGSLQVDLLVGLVIGAGIAGLVGYWFYRWWLGLSMGAVAALLLAVVFSAPRLLDERAAFEDSRMGVGSGQYNTSGVSQYKWEDFRKYFWEQNRAMTLRTLGPVAVAGIVGMVVALVAPRLASIVGTSVLGALLASSGTALLLSTKWPNAWSGVQANARWAMAATGCFWLFSMLYQATHPNRPPTAVPVVPVPASAA